MTTYWKDNDPNNDGTIRLYRSNFTTSLTLMAEVSTSGNSGDGSSSDGVISNPKVDNAQFTYFVDAYLPTDGTNYVGLYGVVIEYTVSEPHEPFPELTTCVNFRMGEDQMWTQLFLEYWLPFLLLAMSVLFLVGGLYLRYRAAASRSWPSVRGTVVVNQVREEILPSEHGGPPVSRYSPIVEYEYTVTGQSYRSRRIRFGGAPLFSSTDRGEIETWMSTHYPEGAEVEVYYTLCAPRMPSWSQEAAQPPRCSW